MATCGIPIRVWKTSYYSMKMEPVRHILTALAVVNMGGMMKASKKWYPRDMECGHRLWFPPGQMPPVNASLWCKSCRTYVRGMESLKRDGETIWNGYVTIPTKTGVMVSCNYVIGCEWKMETRSLADAETQSFRHISREHGRSSILADNTIVKKAIPNEPDF